MPYAGLRTCAACGASNRIPAKHLADTGRCGSCKATLGPVAAPLELDGAAFDEIVRHARVPVLVDFWAAWCGPCRMVAPEVEALAKAVMGRALVVKIDTERNPEVSERFRIQSIPNFMIFRNGQPVFQRAGAAPRAEMERWLEQTTSVCSS